MRQRRIPGKRGVPKSSGTGFFTDLKPDLIASACFPPIAFLLVVPGFFWNSAKPKDLLASAHCSSRFSKLHWRSAVCFQGTRRSPLNPCSVPIPGLAGSPSEAVQDIPQVLQENRRRTGRIHWSPCNGHLLQLSLVRWCGSRPVAPSISPGSAWRSGKR